MKHNIIIISILSSPIVCLHGMQKEQKTSPVRYRSFSVNDITANTREVLSIKWRQEQCKQEFLWLFENGYCAVDKVSLLKTQTSLMIEISRLDKQLKKYR